MTRLFLISLLLLAGCGTANYNKPMTDKEATAITEYMKHVDQ